ncbi:MAG: cation transporter [Deltaproteobacteria bacterium]|nr:cation transporter [Deltaproteobacteria bacterium]
MLLRTLTTAIVIALAAPALAEAPKKAADAKSVVADYKADGVEKPDVAKKLAKALAGHPGVESAKADKDKGRFTVRFDPAKTDAEAIRAKLAKAVPGVTLDAPATPAPPPAAEPTPVFGQPEQGGCGGCPHRNKDGGSCGQH